jgi:hypothetical protein
MLMLPFVAGLALAMAAPTDTVMVLGRVERDLTADGRPEVLRLIGVGPTLDSLDVTFSITSAGELLYQEQLEPLTRNMGYDAGRRRISQAEHRARLAGFGRWFFGENNFTSPDGFVDSLQTWGARHIALIPQVIDRNRTTGLSSDIAKATSTWEAILRSDVTVFLYSPGGDGARALAWSEQDRRFYQLWECC